MDAYEENKYKLEGGEDLSIKPKESIKTRIMKIANELRVSRDSENTFAHYTYISPDVILRSLNPLLLKYELITHFTLEPFEEGFKGILLIEDLDANDNIVYVIFIDRADVKGANKAQISGATLTYAKRYCLMNAFNIADNSDDLDTMKPTQTTTEIVQNDIFCESCGKIITEQIASYSFKKFNSCLCRDCQKNYNA